MTEQQKQQNEKIASKIRKALALAHNNANANEAQNAMLLAQALMAKQGWTLQDVEGFEVKQEKEVVKEGVSEQGRTIWWKKSLASVIADNFKCYCYISMLYKKSQIMFMGLKDDVEVAKNVLDFACRAVDHHSTVYVREYKKINWFEKDVDTAGLKNDFIRGFINGLSDQFKEQVKKNDWGLVLVKDALVEKAYSDMHFRKAQSTSVRGAGSSDARSAGYQKGKSFSSPKGLLK